MSAVKFILWIWLGWMCCALARAETPVLTIYNNEGYVLNEYLDFFEDTERGQGFDDLLLPEGSERFKPLENKLLTFGITRSNLWFRLKLRYPTGAPNFQPKKRWMYEVERTLLNEAELYIVRQDGRYERYTSDVRTPFSKRPVSHAFSVFPVSLVLGEEVTIYLRVWNTTTTYLPQTLWSEAGFADKTTKEIYLYGLFYGGLIIIAIFNFFLFLSSKEVTYIFYVFYLLFILLFAGIDVGHGVTLFGDDNEGFNKRYVLAFLWLALISGTIFIYHFLEIRRRHPVLNYIMVSLMVIMVVSASVSQMFDPSSSVSFAARFTSIVGASIFGMSLYTLHAGNPHSPYFMAAWFFNIMGLMVYAMIVNGLAPAHPALLAALPVGIWLEAIILSQALANRIKQSEKAVSEANRRAVSNLALYRSVFDNALEGLYQMSLGGRLLSVNPAFLRMLGAASKKHLLKDSAPVVAMLYPDASSQLQCLAGTGEWQAESSFINAQGRQMHVLHNARLVQDEQGTPLHIEGTLIDVGERKQREQAQRDRLRERREKELARSVTGAKSLFLKSMSYEIRTPLSAIIGYSESLRHELMSADEKRQAINTITRNSHQLLQLINDILDYSKIEAGKMAVESLPVDLPALIQGIQAHYAPLAAAKHLQFLVDYRFPLPRQIISDPTRLKQVLQNLCSNAIKYTDTGQVTLKVEWDNTQRKLRLEVHDTGQGLSQERIRRLLRAMDQMRGEQVQTGIGLGVAISHQLARLLGGQLDIKSIEGQGSQFVVGLDCALVDNTEWVSDAASDKPVASVLADIPRLQGRVLLAEDNVVNQKLIQRVIMKTGAEVVVVGDGKQAVDTARATPFDLILMDINMPVMGGLDATRALRDASYDRPIYALTAEHGQTEVDASLAAGCNGHLLKPLELGPFYRVLAQCLAPQNRSPV